MSTRNDGFNKKLFFLLNEDIGVSVNIFPRPWFLAGIVSTRDILKLPSAIISVRPDKIFKEKLSEPAKPIFIIYASARDLLFSFCNFLIIFSCFNLERWSTKTRPFKWSISCCKQTESSPSASN